MSAYVHILEAKLAESECERNNMCRKHTNIYKLVDQPKYFHALGEYVHVDSRGHRSCKFMHISPVYYKSGCYAVRLANGEDGEYDVYSTEDPDGPVTIVEIRKRRDISYGYMCVACIYVDYESAVAVAESLLAKN